MDEIENFLKKFKNINLLRVNEKEIELLDEKIKEIFFTKELFNESEYVKISVNIIKEFVDIKENENMLSSFIKKKFEETNNSLFIMQKNC